MVIGNPPYTYRNAISEKEKEYFKRNYNSTEGNFDLYKFFIERLILVTKSYGYSSLIVPNTFLSALTYKKLREIIINEFKVLELFDLGLDVFENVVVESLIFNFKKEKTITQNTLIKIDRIRTGNYFSIENTYTIDLLKYYKKDNNFNIYLSSEIDNIISKTQISKIDLGKITYCTVGINTGYIKDDLTSNIKLDDRYHKMLNGKNIGRNYVEWNGEWVMYDVDFVKSKGDKGRSLPPEYIFTSEKILVQRTRRGMKRKLVCYYDIDKYYNLNRISNIILKDDNYSLKYVFALLNSELLDFYFNKYFNEYEVKPFHLALLPIKILSKEDQQPFIEKADLMLSLNKELQEVSLKFQRSLEREFFDKGFKPLASEKLKPLASETNNALANEKLIPFANKGLKPLAYEDPKPHDINPLSKKLQDWYLLSYGEFIKELEKKKVKLSLSQKAEWETYFLQEAKKAQDLKTTIDTTDKQIDQMVYELYGLTEEEISIIENS
ncbi:MAG: Eco57I restriction-modification methylase domain-containing protein [Flavobacteriaceae bacterium]|nr:Eco57I restriction-modification methylase domain-containing protein [Flavobacteriaceae bacterium]